MRLGIATALVLGAALVACGAKTDLDLRGAGAVGPAPLDPCAALAAAVCDRTLACSPATVTLGAGRARSFRDREECVGRVALGCRAWGRARDTTWNTAMASACATRWQTAPCAVAVTDFGDELLGCGRRLGTRALGAACASSIQCQSGFCRLRDGMCGTCAERSMGPPETQVGGPCTSGRFCSIPQQCIENVCRYSSVEGEACGECLPSLTTRCEAGRCAAMPSVPVGQGCGSVEGPGTRRPPLCESASDCVNRNDFGSGRCRPLVREGDACDVFGERQCQFPARCVRGRCALPSEDCQ
ncbi:MAG: hypothetical protein JNK05_09295 [Myxococcales bacterium]|nr:hypothetical protein [Myxococcales bacterium]